MIDFLLECDSQDTEHFVIQCREILGSEFFAALDNRIGQERFLPKPDEEVLAELEGLRLYVEQTLQAQQSVMKGACFQAPLPLARRNLHLCRSLLGVGLPDALHLSFELSDHNSSEPRPS